MHVRVVKDVGLADDVADLRVKCPPTSVPRLAGVGCPSGVHQAHGFKVHVTGGKNLYPIYNYTHVLGVTSLLALMQEDIFRWVPRIALFYIHHGKDSMLPEVVGTPNAPKPAIPDKDFPGTEIRF